MSTLFRISLQTAVILIILVAHAWAMPQVEAIEPMSVAQGDTLLLTLTGEELPTGGNVRVEFFPQQIVVLAILASTPTELSLQVKVANTAPAGSYNVLVYDLANRGGAEVLGEGLLRVESDMATPLFQSYDPKVIAEATNGFAVLLSGDQIMADAVPYLRMEWSQEGVVLTRLKTTLAYGGLGKVVCAVEGAPPTGLLRGKVFSGETPIYLVEITVQGEEAIFIGHSPAQLSADGQPSFAKFLGAGFSNQFLEMLTIKVSGEGGVWLATHKERLDNSSFLAEFPAGVPVGEYVLEVLQADLRLYSGALWLIEPKIEVTTPGPGVTALEPDVPVVEQAETVVPLEGPEPLPETSGTLAAQVYSVSPEVMPTGTETLRLEFTAESMSISRINQVEAELIIDGEPASLKFVGSLSGGFLCLFDPPLGGWPVGGDGLLLITDSSTHDVVFTRRIPAEISGEMRPSPVDPPSPNADEPLDSTAGTVDYTNAGESEYAATVLAQVQPGIKPEPAAEVPISDSEVETSEPAETLELEPPHEPKPEPEIEVTPAELPPPAEATEAAQESSDKAADTQRSVLIVIEDSTAMYDEQGFMLQLQITGAIPPHEELAAVTLVTEQILLKQNADKFKPIAMGSGAPGIVLLVFRRDQSALEPTAYQLMMDALSEAEEVPVVLRWDDLDTELAARLVFVSAN